MIKVRGRVDVAVVATLENLGNITADKSLDSEGGTEGISFDPGIGEGDIGQSPELPVGKAGGHIPGTTPEITILNLNLSEHPLALAITQATGKGTGGLFDHPDLHRDPTRVIGPGLKGHLDIAEQPGSVETFEVFLQAFAVEQLTRFQGDFAADDPGLGFALNRFTLVVGTGTLLVEELHLHVVDQALADRQHNFSLRTHPGGSGDPGEGIALIGIPFL